jgi:hypothetical protein
VSTRLDAASVQSVGTGDLNGIKTLDTCSFLIHPFSWMAG